MWTSKVEKVEVTGQARERGDVYVSTAALAFPPSRADIDIESTKPYPPYLTSPLTKMKLSWGFILPTLYCSASAADRVAHVYVRDPTARSTATQAPSVSPEAARLILAQRLGISKFHAITPSEDIFQQINEFGGRPAPLFGKREAGNDAHALLWIEGVEDVKGIGSTHVISLYYADPFFSFDSGSAGVLRVHHIESSAAISERAAVGRHGPSSEVTTNQGRSKTAYIPHAY